MAKPVLSPECYTEQRWFDLEQERIFGQLWLFVGLTYQLEQPDSFITRDFSGVPVLVQNTDGQLYAFRNACAHRGMPIQTEVSGVRRMTCPYHGWSYRGNGELRGIPNPKIYDLCDADKAGLRLHAYALQVVGSFIFVNLSANPMPITEQYKPDLLRVLEVLSAHFSPYASYTHFTTDYNWKLNFENVVDWNHVKFVHERSFAPAMEYVGPGWIAPAPREGTFLFGEGGPLEHVPFTVDLPDNQEVRLSDLSRFGRAYFQHTPRWFLPMLENPFDVGGSLTCSLYPNVNFGCIHGEQFYLQQFVPLSPGHTEYHSWMFTARFKADVPPQPQLLWALHHGEKNVLEEDIQLLNALQRTLWTAPSLGIMGAQEGPLNRMGRWYLKQLTGESVS